MHAVGGPELAQELMPAVKPDDVQIQGHGFVDQICRDEVVGWVCNWNIKPGHCHTVLVSTDLGHRTSFAAHIHRPDVVAAVGRPGKYGFAIPIALLPPFREQVVFHDSDSRPLGNGTLTLAPPPLAAPKPRYLVLHIPKTAGTSLRVFLASNFGQGETCEVYGTDLHLSAEEFSAIDIAQRASFRIVVGHVDSSLSATIPGKHRLITFMREPMKRMRSHVLHHLRHIGPNMNVDGVEVPLVDAANSEHAVAFDNIQLRMTAALDKANIPKLSPYHVTLAVTTLLDRFDFVGRVENMDADFQQLCQLLDVPEQPLCRKNVASEIISVEEQEVLDKIDWDRVRARNAFDIALYEWVRENSSWFNKRYRHARPL